MGLNDIRNYFAYILRQHPDQNKELSPTEFTDLLNICQLLHFKKKVGLPEDYQPGHPDPRQQFEITKKITMDLQKFIVLMAYDTSPLHINNLGVAALPSLCYYPISFLYKYVKKGVVLWKDVDIVTSGDWADRMSDSIIMPTKKHPIACVLADTVRFAPVDLKLIEFTYLRRPRDCYFAEDTTGGYLAYDVTNSVQCEFDEINIIDIMQLMLERIGINIGRGDIVQLHDKFKKEGE